MRYWLVKSEPTCYSIDDFKSDRVTLWDNVRNYQARNFLKEMAKQELVFFYHSSCDQLGIVGHATVLETAVPDPGQFNQSGDYFEPRATVTEPIWYAPKLKFERVYRPLISRSELLELSDLGDMELLKKGSRLSVLPVKELEFKTIRQTFSARF